MPCKLTPHGWDEDWKVRSGFSKSETTSNYLSKYCVWEEDFFLTRASEDGWTDSYESEGYLCLEYLFVECYVKEGNA